jgi:hypothetical protein
MGLQLAGHNAHQYSIDIFPEQAAARAEVLKVKKEKQCMPGSNNIHNLEESEECGDCGDTYILSGQRRHT